VFTVVLSLAVALPATSIASNPTVIATSPANGETGVSPDLPSIVLTFSEAMSGGWSFSGLPSGWTGQWSPDMRVLTMSRPAGAPSWATGTILTIVLNPPPYFSFADLEGNSLGTYTFSFTVGNAVSGAPTVTATNPANGALRVTTGLASVSISFSEPMDDGVNVSTSGPWPLSGSTALAWSADRRTLTVARDSLPDPLPTSSVITFWLNPNGGGFADPDGNPLGAYSFSFTTEPPGPAEPPVVESTDPIAGARDAGCFRQFFTITFSKPMQPTHSLVCDAGGWDLGASSFVWASDHRTLYVLRPQDNQLLPAGVTMAFTLNPPGQQGFIDTDGNPLATWSFEFTVEAPGDLLKVQPEDSSHDFSWPYYLWIPGGLSGPTTLLVEPNNTGTTSDVELHHDSSAMSLVGWHAAFAARLDVPLLVPTFPRPSSFWTTYTHALDRDSFTTSVEGIVRIDLQLIEMIDDAIERLADLGIEAESRVLMFGFSASGQFTNRFAILHPDRIRAAAAGSPGGWPLAPVDEWEGETLPYNVGIADASSLLGHPLDMAEVRAVPLYIYMGDADTNDSVPFDDSYDPVQRELVNRLFGTSPIARWPHAQAIYAAAGMNATFVLYPGVGHTITNQMLDDIAAFFTANRLPPSQLVRRAEGRRAPP
jgi:pimeloyl-ACP methyl ester carboxylesterase